MEDRHRRLLDALLTAVAEGQGHLGTDVRRKLVAGRTMAGALGSFAIKVAQNPSTIGDDHIAALARAGHSEDALFECILAAALGAGMERFRAGLSALEGKSDAAE